tara:strand:- start:4055 stop:4975 length:921 start_codon:yes stop_codon:yes gene_type:complete
MAKNNFVLSSERIYKDNVSSNVVNARDIMEQMFSKKINLLLESKRPRKSYSTKGKLCSRRLYQTPFNDNVFTKHNHIPTSDTTIVMLIDASGSMDGSVNINLGTEGYKMRQLEACNAVVSAFAKSVDRVTNNAIKLEVFTKTSADIADSNILGMRGAFPALTRVFTNSTKRMDVDRILQLDTMSPIIRKREDGERDGIGSSTPEYAVLPALFNWIKKNVTTKNIVVFNLTDGDTYSMINKVSIGNEFTKQMREKYLRHTENVTFYIDGEESSESKKVYGNNIIGTDGDFITPMFDTLIKIFNKSIT